MTDRESLWFHSGSVPSVVAAFLLLTACALSGGCNDESDANIVAYENLPKPESPQPDASSDNLADSDAEATNSPDPTTAVGPDDPDNKIISESAPVDSTHFTAAPLDTTSDEDSPADGSLTESASQEATGSETAISPEEQGISTASYPDPGPEDLDNGSATEAPRKIELLIPQKRFRRGGPDGSVRVSYDDIDLLKILNMEPVPKDAADHFPDWLNGLDGQRVVIRGFMYPTYQLEGLESFTLARDNGICCFVRKPKIYDIIRIQMRDGVTADYVQNRPIDLVGVFHINPTADEHELYRLYSIDDAVVLTR